MGAQEDVLIRGFVELDDRPAQIVENETDSSFSYEQNEVMLSCVANNNFCQKERRGWPARLEQQMAFCNGIIATVSIIGKDLPFIVIPAYQQTLGRDARIDN